MNENRDNDCLDPENNSKCCFFKVANAFLLLAVFLLFMVLCFYAPRVIDGKSLGFDYIGVIVAILAILVTVLIGWQIWATIDTRRIIERFDERIRANENAVNRLQQQFSNIGEIAIANTEIANAQIIVASIISDPARANAHQYAESYQFASTALTRLIQIQGITNELIRRCFTLLNQILTNSQGILDNPDMPNALKNQLITEYTNFRPLHNANRALVLPHANPQQLSELERLLNLRRGIEEHPTFPNE